jgi:hypothetical protein
MSLNVSYVVKSSIFCQCFSISTIWSNFCTYFALHHLFLLLLFWINSYNDRATDNQVCGTLLCRLPFFFLYRNSPLSLPVVHFQILTIIILPAFCCHLCSSSRYQFKLCCLGTFHSCWTGESIIDLRFQFFTRSLQMFCASVSKLQN